MPDIQVGDLVRIAEDDQVGDWKRKSNLWTVLGVYGEKSIHTSATIHNGHKQITLPQYLLEKV